MDKLLDLFLKTPIAKSIAVGLIERALLAGFMALGTWLAIGTSDYELAVKQFASDAAPLLVVIVFTAVAVKRIKKGEVKIEVARQSLPIPRAVLDQKVNEMSAEDKRIVLAPLYMRRGESVEPFDEPDNV